METLIIAVGFCIMLIGISIAFMGGVIPLALGKSNAVWYPKVLIASVGVGVIVTLFGFAIVIYNVFQKVL